MTGGEDDKANQHWQNHAAMEVKKPVGSRRRQLVLTMLMPISGDGDVASREEDSIFKDRKSTRLNSSHSSPSRMPSSA